MKLKEHLKMIAQEAYHAGAVGEVKVSTVIAPDGDVCGEGLQGGTKADFTILLPSLSIHEKPNKYGNFEFTFLV